MKKFVFALAALAALSSVLSAQAETIKVFVSNIGQVTGFSNKSYPGFATMLHENDMDFGYVCGPKSRRARN